MYFIMGSFLYLQKNNVGDSMAEYGLVAELKMGIDDVFDFHLTNSGGL